MELLFCRDEACPERRTRQKIAGGFSRQTRDCCCNIFFFVIIYKHNVKAYLDYRIYNLSILFEILCFSIKNKKQGISVRGESPAEYRR